MDPRPIGIFDSGAGGISVLKEIRKLMPWESLIFFGDDANAPYGTKPQEQVCAFSQNAVRFLLGKGCKAVVIACNTATAAAAAFLREKYDMPIIGMEPAIKPASALRKVGIVISMATPGTLGSRKYGDLMARYGEGVVPLPCPGLMEFAERGELGSAELHDYLRRLFLPFADRQVDAVVLGCTHYVFLRRAIAAHFPPGTAIVDGNLGTAKQLARRLKETGLEASRDAEGTVRIYSSGGEESLKIFRRLYEAEDEA